MTHSRERHGLGRALHDDSGMALLIAVIVLLLMSALALSALQHAGDEAVGSGSSRRKDATLYAAESGQAWVRIALENFALSGSVTDPNISMYDPAFVKDAFGNPIEVSTGKPENGGLPATPTPVAPVKDAKPQLKLGNLINQGGRNSGNGTALAWQSDITTRDAGNGMAHVLVQYAVPDTFNY
jgi:hypothetical protein